MISSTWLNYNVLKSKHKICVNSTLNISKLWSPIYAHHIVVILCIFIQMFWILSCHNFSNENIFIKLYILLKAWKMLCVSDTSLFDLNSFLFLCRLCVTSKRYQLLPFRFMFMFEYFCSVLRFHSFSLV